MGGVGDALEQWSRGALQNDELWSNGGGAPCRMTKRLLCNDCGSGRSSLKLFALVDLRRDARPLSRPKQGEERQWQEAQGSHLGSRGEAQSNHLGSGGEGQGS